MKDVGIALGLHLFGVVWWIGGLTFVTMVFLPLARAGKLGDMQTVFHHIEGRFAPQVKTALFIVGLTGLYMLWRRDLWHWAIEPAHWYIGAMIVYWTWFFLMLFVLGPSGMLKKMMKGTGADKASDEQKATAEASAWKRLHIIHGVLMCIGWVIIIGAGGRYFF